MICRGYVKSMSGALWKWRRKVSRPTMGLKELNWRYPIWKQVLKDYWVWGNVERANEGTSGKGNKCTCCSEKKTKSSSILKLINSTNLTPTNQALSCDLKTETHICWNTCLGFNLFLVFLLQKKSEKKKKSS